MDFSEMTDEEVNALLWECQQERDRRYALAMIPGQMDDMNRAYLTHEGTVAGSDWRQPTGAHDAYPYGFEVRHVDKNWVSLVASNVWEPGVSGWGEKVGEGEIPGWVQPTGAHDAYPINAVVSHNGGVWRSIVDANVWEPGVYGWEEQDTA